jgi:hypothetical protein
MKDAIDRRAALGVSASVPTLALRAIVMATPADPILTSIERDRIAYVTFVTSFNRTDEGKAAKETRDVIQAHKDAHAASGVEEDAVSEPEG